MNASSDSARAEIPGSERQALSGAELVGPVEPDEQITVTVLVPRRANLPALTADAAHLQRSELAAKYGADPEDIAAVEKFAQAHGLDVSEVNPAARTLSLSGSASALDEAFGVELHYYEHRGTRYRGREGTITVPAELKGVVVGVLGLDTRVQAKPHIRKREDADAGEGEGTFTPVQVGELYGFAAEATGENECIGLIELGGGYEEADLNTFFEQLNLEPPKVVSVGVNEGKNNFAEGGEANGEVALDIEVAGALAPRSKIAVYFAPNTDQGFLAAINQAIHDDTNQPSILSISWGMPEANWTQQAMIAMDEAFADAAALGISVFVASGDNGSADRLQFVEEPNGAQVPNPEYDGTAHVNFPASSPHAIACGGTRLESNGGAISSETVWNDGNGWGSGGGVSDVFDIPTWQEKTDVSTSVNPPGTRKGRGVPDIAGNADSETGYQIYYGGKSAIVGGTSAVAPLWAGITARLNQLAARRLGFLNTTLYAAAAQPLRDITEGTNAIAEANGQPATPGYDAGKGWDACTGLGSPEGQSLRTQFIGGAPAAAAMARDVTSDANPGE